MNREGEQSVPGAAPPAPAAAPPAPAAAPPAPAAAAPVAAGERIVSLDVLRGVAILGILLMNIQGFSMIEAAYLNPTAYGDLTGVNRLVWTLSHLFADLKFISIFSMLFGAGIVLFSKRLEAAGRRPASLHYRRVFWLLVIGLAHGFLLWYGDILTAYALVALVAFLFRKVRPLPLLIVGLVVVSVSSLLYLLGAASMPYAPPEAFETISYFWQPSAEAVADEVAAYRGSWIEQMSHRMPSMIASLTIVFWMNFVWRVGGLMLVGMALFKWGVLSAERSRRFYAALATVGLAVGFPLIGLGIVRRFASGWSIEYAFFNGAQYNYWGSLFVALAYVGLVMLWVRSRPLGRLGRAFAAAGRMAFTNYLMQTVICTTIFYGHGFGLFGSMERSGQILIVFAVWVFQLWFSTVWLERFRFGPVEWLWRTLTYLKPPPMRR